VPEIPQPTQDQKLDEKTLNVLINAMHELDVRIVGLNRDGCHCGLVARVALNALNPDKIREAAYRAGREDAARDIDEWASGYEAFAKGESNTELVVMNLRHAGRIARVGKDAKWLGRERDEEQHG
jgi:hypothetical protein